MKIRIGFVLLGAVGTAALVAACVGTVTESEESALPGSDASMPLMKPMATSLPPPGVITLPATDIVVTSPGTGSVADAGYMQFTGYASNPGVGLAIQAQSLTQNAATDPWTLIGIAVTSDAGQVMNGGSELAYPWTFGAGPGALQAIVDGGAVNWDGGLLRVRTVRWKGGVTAQDSISDQDTIAANCFAAAVSSGSSWNDAGLACSSVFSTPTIIASNSSIPGQPDFAATSATPPYLTKPAPGLLNDAGGYDTLGNLSETSHYYAATGASLNTPTLAAFEAYYGFGASDAHAIYYNSADLGLGRDMHCVSWTRGKGAGEACYVKNFAPSIALAARTSGAASAQAVQAGVVGFGVDPAGTLAATIASADAGPSAAQNELVATVAMVSSHSVLNPTAPPYVTFAVFGATGALQNFAKLDYLSPQQSVPGNCLTCHGAGASYDPIAHAIVGRATFLAFDPGSFIFQTGTSPYTLAAQQPALRQLNIHVMNSNPTAGVSSLIAELYSHTGGLYTAGALAQDGIVPTPWDPATTGVAGSGKLYNDVIHPYCVTCHSSIDPQTSDPLASYASALAASGNILNDVCGASHGAAVHVMPQAEQTMIQFWGGGARAYLAAGFGWNRDCTP